MACHARSAQVPRPRRGDRDHGARPLLRRRAGFTLFEVGISLVLVSFGVVSVIILFPVGIKAQEAARYKVYAAGMAMQFVESYNTAHNANPAFETEGPNFWDVHVTGRNMAPDLEARCSSYRFGMYPLPITIAQRLDSDNDEIQSILSQGGYLYYPQPLANSGLTDTGFVQILAAQGQAAQGTGQVANDAQKVIMAVEGNAQNNALYALPQKAWPYYAAYPSAPIVTPYNGAWLAPGQWSPNWPSGQFYLWEDVGSGDPDMRSIWSNTWPIPAPPMPGTQLPPNLGGLYWHQVLPPYQGAPPAVLSATNSPSAFLGTATGYMACALWYAHRKGLDSTLGGRFFNGTATLNDVTSLFQAPPSNFAQQVNALRFLANAAIAVSGYWDVSAPASEPIPSLTFTSGGSSPSGFNLTPAMITNYHEMCLAVGARFAASFPYDWGAPRMLQRAIMMDNPLIEFDLLQPGNLITGSVYGLGTAASAWRPVAAQPVRNLGLSATYPGWNLGPNGGNTLVSENALDASLVPNVPQPQSFANGNPLWGDGQNDFSLAAPFAPADRCRQLVFWTVDWQSYEDCETAPSAPVDAGKYMIGAPVQNQTYTGFQLNNPGFMAWQQFGYMNPEKAISWYADQTNIQTGTVESTIGLGNAGGTTLPSPPFPANTNVGNQRYDAWVQGLGSYNDPAIGALPPAPYLFNGMYGADRNFNGKLDRGPLSKAVRLRAVLLARFNYYDLRVPAPIR